MQANYILYKLIYTVLSYEGLHKRAESISRDSSSSSLETGFRNFLFVLVDDRLLRLACCNNTKSSSSLARLSRCKGSLRGRDALLQTFANLGMALCPFILW